MATGRDQLAGAGLVALSSALFIYYSVWILALPFTGAGHGLQRYFPAREYAVMLPLAAGLALLLSLGLFMLLLLWRSRDPPKKAD